MLKNIIFDEKSNNDFIDMFQSHNKIRERIKYIEISNVCGLYEIPDQMLTMYNLEVLIINNACLNYLPAFFSSFPELFKLDLSHNEIESIEHMPYMYNLEELNLSYNKMTSFPKIDDKMPRLRMLNVSHNKLRGMPSLSKLNRLDEYYVGYNCFECIFDALQPIVDNIKRTNVDKNAICCKISNKEYFSRDFNKILKDIVVNPMQICIGDLYFSDLDKFKAEYFNSIAFIHVRSQIIVFSNQLINRKRQSYLLESKRLYEHGFYKEDLISDLEKMDDFISVEKKCGCGYSE